MISVVVEVLVVVLEGVLVEVLELVVVEVFLVEEWEKTSPRWYS